MKIIDLSLELDNSCMVCGTAWHPKMNIVSMGTIDDVGRNTHKITFGSHTGTHMDAPLHFIKDGIGIDKIDLSLACGPVTVADLSYIREGGAVKKEDIEHITVTERMLFIFGWDRNWKKDTYYKDFPYFSMEAVELLISKGMRLMAMDTPSPDPSGDIGGFNDSCGHKMLLKNKVIIVEYLTNTAAIDIEKQYDIIALPLKLKDVDGSPARVILVEKEGN